jgi:hypothetical protein
MKEGPYGRPLHDWEKATQPYLRAEGLAEEIERALQQGGRAQGFNWLSADEAFGEDMRALAPQIIAALHQARVPEIPEELTQAQILAGLTAFEPTGHPVDVIVNIYHAIRAASLPPAGAAPIPAVKTNAAAPGERKPGTETDADRIRRAFPDGVKTRGRGDEPAVAALIPDELRRLSDEAYTQDKFTISMAMRLGKHDAALAAAAVNYVRSRIGGGE